MPAGNGIVSSLFVLFTTSTDSSGIAARLLTPTSRLLKKALRLADDPRQLTLAADPMHRLYTTSALSAISRRLHLLHVLGYHAKNLVSSMRRHCIDSQPHESPECPAFTAAIARQTTRPMVEQPGVRCFVSHSNGYSHVFIGGWHGPASTVIAPPRTVRINPTHVREPL